MAVGVGLGLADFPFSSADAFWEWVDLCEEGGVDSLWQTDRLVSPIPILECMSAMAALAGRTRRMKFGMNVASLGLRDPLLTAKQCATIDFLSNGRLLPAFGVGSPVAPDWTTTGRSPKGSGKIADEAMDIVTRLWREDAVTFKGEHFSYENARIEPKPVQKKIPFWIGGSSKPAIRRTAKYGTGWQAGQETALELPPVLDAIKAALEGEGRSIDSDHYGAGFHFRFGDWDDADLPKRMGSFAKRTGRDPKQHFAVGGADAILERIEGYADAGISKFILRPIGLTDAELMAQTERLITDVIPEAIKLQATV
ncbi:MAG: LLM class flavin-dependent oxidoreductase [Alphaproteobacteria bacterium]